MTDAKHEIQRYRIDDATETRPTQAIKDSTGGWVLYLDHKERIAQLTADLETQTAFNKGAIVEMQKFKAENEQLRRDLSQWCGLAESATDDLIRDRLHGIPKLKAERDAALRENECLVDEGLLLLNRIAERDDANHSTKTS